jgi:hypothetical protein
MEQLKNELASLMARWTKVQADFTAEFGGNEYYEEASDDITFALSMLNALTA